MKSLATALAILLLMPLTYAAGYYADLEVNVDNLDFVEIKGDTNLGGLLTERTEAYVTKDKGVRTLHLETEETLSEYLLKVNLPKGTSINYVKTTGSFRIESKWSKLSIVAVGEDTPISMTVQYQITKSGNTYIYLGLFMTVLLLILSSYLLQIGKPKKLFKKKKVYDLRGLTPRQKAIMKLLIENPKKPFNQKEIEKELKLPKASVSRNIRSLSHKGMITKHKTGMSNIVTLKDK